MSDVLNGVGLGAETSLITKTEGQKHSIERCVPSHLMVLVRSLWRAEYSLYGFSMDPYIISSRKASRDNSYSC